MRCWEGLCGCEFVVEGETDHLVVCELPVRDVVYVLASACVDDLVEHKNGRQGRQKLWFRVSALA